ncbi:cache domain-containing sensor histidine kinase [Enterocloster bolteae]|uniref:cache domain-containing sensor histidine kinase n=1 Tax=Enterocloster bolteae TaxID=208479 RepID=UPI0026752815|nr:histidine kinase [Enterocloster bolteae]
MKGEKSIPGKLYHKMVAVNMLTSLIPLVLFSIFSLYTFNNNYLQLISRQYSDAIETSSTILGYYLDSFYNIVKLNIDDNQDVSIRTLETIFSESTEEEERRRQIEVLLEELSQANPYIRSCLFVDREGSVYSFHRDGKELSDPALFLRQMDYRNRDRYGEEPFLVPVHETAYFPGEIEDALSVGKVYETPGMEGTLYIEVNPDALNVVFSDKQLYGRGYLKILNSRGSIVYQREQDLDRRAASIAANLRQLVFSMDVPGKDLTISFSIDKVTVMADVYVLRGLMILMILCCVTLVLIVSFRFSRQLTSPINRMMEKMDLLKRGDFSGRLPVESNDEIGVLSRHFNDMSEQLHLHINQSYLAQIKEKEAELNALKSQIYPHFLYNTLEVIRMTAFEQNDQKVADMIEALSSQMRYIIGTTKDVVPLKMEVELLGKFIGLINCRYEGKVSFETDMDGFGECLIPKMILQPIVENAFFHGLKPMDGNGVIQLLAEETEGDLTITIMDNGVGMSETEKGRMEELLSSDRPGNKEEYNWQSVGLKNVHDRVRYLYGPQYGLTFVSHEGIGTAVSVKIPKNLEEH